MALTIAGRRRRSRRRPTVGLGEESVELVRARRDATLALVGAAPSGVAGRVRTAPPAYVICHEPADIARHCALLDSLPRPGEIRVAVTPARAGARIDVATRDRPGLLAALTGVLTVCDLPVDQAVVATWEDGAVLDAFLVRTTSLPHVGLLEGDLEAALTRPVSSDAVTDAEITFDDHTSAWYTVAEVRARDRPGLFHALAVAISGAGADVHAARATTRGGAAHDRFDLTDLTGDKLDPDTKVRIRALVASGTPTTRSRVV